MSIEHYIAGFDFPVGSNHLLNGGFESDSFWTFSGTGSLAYTSSIFLYGTRSLNFSVSFIETTVVTSYTLTLTSQASGDDGCVQLGYSGTLLDAGKNFIVGRAPYLPNTPMVYKSFIRIPNVTMAQSDNVTDSYFDLNLTSGSSEPVDWEIFIQDADNPSPVTSKADYDSRSWSTINVAWTLSVSMNCGACQTPNLASLIQRAVNRPGWASGNSLMFAIMPASSSPNDKYSIVSGYTAGASLRPELYIEVGG